MKRTIAWWVSAIGHPFVMIVGLLTYSLLRKLPALRALPIVATVVALTVVPLAVMILRKVRRGEWSDGDVSLQRQRGPLYAVAISLSVVAIGVLAAARLSTPIVLGAVTVFAMLAAAYVINRWIKVSLHLTFATFTAIAIGATWPALGASLAVILIPALIWSRTTLGRHSSHEVSLGLLLGGISGAALLAMASMT
ncbi:MAG: hypothetical protein ACYC7A_21570 [Thermoanaerobaculia bacterium]